MNGRGLPVPMPRIAVSIPGHDVIFRIEDLKLAVQALVASRHVDPPIAPEIVKVRG